MCCWKQRSVQRSFLVVLGGGRAGGVTVGFILLTCIIMSQKVFKGESREENWKKSAEVCPVNISCISVAAFSVRLSSCLRLSLGNWLVMVIVQNLTVISWPTECMTWYPYSCSSCPGVCSLHVSGQVLITLLNSTEEWCLNGTGMSTGYSR